MKFEDHLVNDRDTEKSYINNKSINQRKKAWKLMLKVANLKTRKIIAYYKNFMSKIIYLQKAHNRAARFLTKLEWNTPTVTLW